MKGRARFQIPLGVSSLVLVLAVLCLGVFSVLALMTASRELRLAEKSALNAERYYAADQAAERLAAELIGRGQMGEKVPDALDGRPIAQTVSGGRRIVSLLVPIDELRGIALGVDYDGGQVEYLRVVSLTDWTPNSSLAVWGGETP